MNTPNKLTMLRVIMVPIFMIAYMYTSYNILSMLIFVLAFLTDMLDGYLARKNNQVSNFG